MQNQIILETLNGSTKKIVQRISTKKLSSIENLKLAEKISVSLKISKIISEILINRGYDNIESAKSFLYPTLRNDLPDPSSLKNAVQVTKLITDSINKNKYITIYSDFDVDGITSAAQLWMILKNAGAKLRYYVPNRMKEGYGLSE
jgi:single-stranded-DNA-specific exonuclease